jgi:hypothetical protein
MHDLLAGTNLNSFCVLHVQSYFVLWPHKYISIKASTWFTKEQ